MMGNYIEVVTWEIWLLLVIAAVAIWLPFRRKFRAPRDPD